MASDLLRVSERACIIALKNNAPLAALVAETSIDPSAEAPTWPFIRLDGTQAVPAGRGCTARSEVRFALHTFAKPYFTGSGALAVTARDQASRIHDAVVEAIHGHAFVVDGRRYRFAVLSARSMQDGAERDAWHCIANIVARAYVG